MDRVAIKKEARELTKTNKWNVWKPVLAVALISSIVAALISIVGGEESVAGGIISVIFSLAIVPVSVGVFAYNLKLVRGEEFSLNDLKAYYPFYLKIFCIGILTTLFVFLWSLLFIIPGIIAGLSYAMTSFVFIDNTDLSAIETIKKSKELMNGYKMDYFVFQLSFIGWNILAMCTLGILYIWLFPYMTIAETMYYDKLIKEKK